MTLTQLKEHIIHTLLAIYPKDEIVSFLYLLSEHYLNLRRIDFSLQPNHKITEIQWANFEAAIDKLKKEEPIQYIIGKTIFYDESFMVNHHVLIPRPETEELVDWIIRDHQNTKEPLKILDMGTGSGCIPISLKKHLRQSDVFAMDISEEALEVAKRNAEALDVSIHWLHEDILTIKSFETSLDIIVSNPPYVRMLEKNEMAPNVLDNEPHLALFVENDDALLFYRKIASFASTYLKDTGILYFEINQYLGLETKVLVEQFGFDVVLKKDLNGNDRMLKATKRSI